MFQFQTLNDEIITLTPSTGVLSGTTVTDPENYISEYGTDFGSNLLNNPDAYFFYMPKYKEDATDTTKYLGFYRWSSTAQVRTFITNSIDNPPPPAVNTGVSCSYNSSYGGPSPDPLHVYLCYYPATAETPNDITNAFVLISYQARNELRWNAVTLDVNRLNELKTLLNNAAPIVVPPTDPYAGGGTSATGGGTGTFDGSTAEVDFPAGTPTAGAGASGFIKLFNPTAANLAALAAYLWGTFDISSYKSIYNNPIDCIVALTVVPVQPTTGAAATISLGNVASDVTAPTITNQFVIFDCGSININEFWGAYLDYDPYTKCEIYLPYIGVQDIDINDIQGKTIQLKYYIDVLSGACVAMLKCADDVLYNWSGQCGAEVPITSTSFGSAFQTALSVGNAIGETIVNAMSGIPQSLSLVASSVFNGARSKVHKSGSIGSMAGHMGIQKPYLIITRPVQSVPENLNEITGYPSNITATLGDLSGYTEVETIHLAGIPATSEEMTEIEELLKGGVFI